MLFAVGIPCAGLAGRLVWIWPCTAAPLHAGNSLQVACIASICEINGVPQQGTCCCPLEARALLCTAARWGRQRSFQQNEGRCLPEACQGTMLLSSFLMEGHM